MRSLEIQTRDEENPRHADFYQLIRNQIEHEDELSTNRVIWLLLSEAFLLTAYATILNFKGDDALLGQQRMLLWLTPLTGLIAGVVSYLAVVASIISVGRLRDHYASYMNREPQESPPLYYPPIQGTALPARLTRISMLGLPVIFFVVWLLILGYHAASLF